MSKSGLMFCKYQVHDFLYILQTFSVEFVLKESGRNEFKVGFCFKQNIAFQQQGLKKPQSHKQLL